MTKKLYDPYQKLLGFKKYHYSDVIVVLFLGHLLRGS